MVYIGLMIRLQKRTNSSDTLQAMGRTFLKSILTYLYYAKYKNINICHSGKQKHVSQKENSTSSINILHTGSHKSLPIYYGL